MSIVLNGVSMEIPNVKTTSWVGPTITQLGDLQVKKATKTSKRKKWLRGIVCHTVHGKLGNLLPGIGPDTNMDVHYAKYQVSTDRSVSWDFTCDLDGSWLIQNDPVKEYTWQATHCNSFTCGFEMIQLENGDMYEGQIQKVVEFVDFLTAKLGIQRQIPWDTKRDKPVLSQVKRLSDKDYGAGEDVVGVYSHVNLTSNRGKGDCGPWLPVALAAAGYEKFCFDDYDDKITWQDRQQRLLSMSSEGSDGIPGPSTVEALKSAGYKHGMFIRRPVDDLI